MACQASAANRVANANLILRITLNELSPASAGLFSVPVGTTSAVAALRARVTSIAINNLKDGADYAGKSEEAR